MEGAERVVVVGTDCPAITSRLVNHAFRALGHADLVLGPSMDGGYYLIGLRAPRPELFREIPWSTNLVLDATLRRAREIGCDYRLLRRLRDVDTLADAQALGLWPDRPAIPRRTWTAGVDQRRSSPRDWARPREPC